MARPKIERGADWFRHSVKEGTKGKLSTIVEECGCRGYGIINLLFEHIYGGDGYFIAWDERSAKSFSRRVALEDTETVQEVVKLSLDEGIFNRDLYDHFKILTSKEIQADYFDIIAKRSSINVNPEYLLVPAPTPHKKDSAKKNGDSDAETPNNSTETPISEEVKNDGYDNSVNSAETPVNSTETPVISEFIPQSKSKSNSKSTELEGEGEKENPPEKLYPSDFTTSLPYMGRSVEKNFFSLSDVVSYAQHNGIDTKLARQYFYAMKNQNWEDRNGKPIRNWQSHFFKWASATQKNEAERKVKAQKENDDEEAVYEILRDRYLKELAEDEKKRQEATS